MKTKTIFTALFLGLMFISKAQSTEPTQIKSTNSKTTTISGATDETAHQQLKAADGDVDKWRGNDKPKPKPKTTTISGTTDETADQQLKVADGDVDKWRGNDKPKPKPKTATINGATDDSTNPQPAKSNINKSRSNIKNQ